MGLHGLRPAVSSLDTSPSGSEFGAARSGARVVGRGSFAGPQLKGQVLAGGGADWLLFRRDGAAQLDVRGVGKRTKTSVIYSIYAIK